MIDVRPIKGCLIGTAVGDSLGLPYEGISAQRARKLFPFPLKHRLVFGRGMCSDDTEHACMTAQALLASGGEVDRFKKSLAWRLRWWLLGIPAGIGLATLRSIIKLWIGFSPDHSGVFSAGNGPAMRAAILGICLGDDLDKLRAFIRASTRITHTDPKAERGAMAIAVAAWHARQLTSSSEQILDAIQQSLPDADEAIVQWMALIRSHLAKQSSPSQLADEIGLSRGVGGYIYHTVPVALFIWLRFRNDFRRCIEETISLGGDTDTTAAIVGALCGIESGVEGIPEEWIEGILEFSRSIAWITQLAEQFTSDAKPLPLAWWWLIPRNIVFAAIVLLHGFRRLLPPW